jgi:CRISPR-associated protein Cas6/Cse3/CasE subtype I-E
MYNFIFKKEYNEMYEAHQDITHLFNSKEVQFAVEGTTVFVRQPTLPINPVSGKMTKQELFYKEGKVISFRVRCNVSVRDSKTQKDIPVTDSLQQSAWFHRRSEMGGFKVRGMSVIHEEPVKVNRKNIPFSLNSVVYEGELEVIDANKFSEVLIKGVGKKSTFGFGMMRLYE